MTFGFIRDDATRAACQRLLLLADLREARAKHKPTFRLLRAVKEATHRALEKENDRRRTRRHH